MDLLHRRQRHGRAAPLRAHLEDGARLLLNAAQNRALGRRAGAGLLDVDRLAGLHRRNRRPGVPVVRRRADEAVDRRILQHLAHVGRRLRLHARHLQDLRNRRLARPGVDVAHDRDLHARQFRRTLHQLKAAAARMTAHHRQAHAVRRRIHAECAPCRRNRKKSDSTTDELTSLHDPHPFAR